MAIVVDISHLLFRNIFASQTAVIENPNLVAHLMLNSLFSITNSFEVDSQNVLIAAFDSYKLNYWRTKYYEENSKEFPEYNLKKYKGNRVKDVTMPWKEIYAVINDVKELLDEGTDVQVLFHENAEADDIIYAVTKYYNDVTIISSDRDFHQLVGGGRGRTGINQYDPIKKQYISIEDSFELLQQDILTGQKRKDNILPCEKGMGPVTAKKKIKNLKGFLESDPLFEAHYNFNKKLIDLSQVPDWILEDIIEVIKQPHFNYSLKKMVEFCRKYELRKISEKIDQLRFKKTNNIFEALG